MILNIAIYIVIGLMGLGLLLMAASGVRSLLAGKVKMLSLAFMAVPIVLLLVMGLVVGDWAQAGILTILISLGLTLLALLASGVKSIFS